MGRPPKIGSRELLQRIRNAERTGRFVLVTHAVERSQERNILDYEIREVMRDGYHEARKDVWKEGFEEWNYAIRGKTLGDRELRIIVVIEEPDLLVITVIDLDLD